MSETLRAHLFIPCLVEDCQPEIGEAVVSVLEHLGLRPELPRGQSCCGQLAYKTGDLDGARTLALRYLEVFRAPGPVVCPSGSCVKMVRTYPTLFAPGTPEHARATDLAGRTFEFCQFVAGELGRVELGAQLATRACYHGSCQVDRALGITQAPRDLLRAVRGLTLVEAARPDRCCGFGGVFSLQFTGVSQALVEDKTEEILATGAEMLVSAEPSCLMNIGGHLARRGSTLPTLHVAQVLALGLGLEKGNTAWK